MDEAKAAANRDKHGISFETAQGVWLDPYCLELPATRAEDGEDRWKVIGKIETRLFTVVFTEREHFFGDHVRIISARRANTQEEKAYDAAYHSEL